MVTAHFKTYSEAEAFQRGILAVLGLLGISTEKIRLGHILPLTGTGYYSTVALTSEKE